MTVAPANGNQPAFQANNLIPVHIDMINAIGLGPNIRMALGNITGIEGEYAWRSVIVLSDDMAAALIALLTSTLHQKGIIAQGEAINVGGSHDAQDKKRPN